MKRPTGVTVIALLLWLTGVLNLAGGLSAMSDVSSGAGLVQVVAAVAAIVFGFGCWQLRSWARLGTIIVMAGNAIAILVLWAQFSDRVIVSRIIWPLLINVVVAIYLLQPAARRAFRRRSGTPVV
jgi:hypothetical protein